MGEQQRLAFGRVLVNQPRFVILDEATSALDMVAEARMYNLLRNRAVTKSNGKISSSGTTFVSVGHRPSLLAYHDIRLRLRGEEGFEVETINTSGIENEPSEVNNM